jgi:hypothetical protein
MWVAPASCVVASTASTPWHLDAVSKSESHPPHLLFGPKNGINKTTAATFGAGKGYNATVEPDTSG